MQALRFAHFFCTALYLIQKIPYFLYTSGSIGRHGIAKLFQTEFHIMEVGNRLAQFIGNIGKHCLEITESYACIIRIFGVNRFVGPCIGNKRHDTPITLTIMPISLSCIGRKEMQHLTFNVFLAFLFQFLTDMSGYGIDIGLQHFYVLENGMIDTLQYIIGGISLESAYFIGVINKTGP